MSRFNVQAQQGHDTREPDDVAQQCFAAGIHDAVQGGVVGMGERVEAVLGRRLQSTLHLDQGLSQFGRFD